MKEMIFLDHCNPFLSRMVIMYTAYINVKNSASSVQGVSYDLQHTAVLLVHSTFRLVLVMETRDKKLFLNICYMNFVLQTDRQVKGLNQSWQVFLVYVVYRFRASRKILATLIEVILVFLNIYPNAEIVSSVSSGRVYITCPLILPTCQ